MACFDVGQQKASNQFAIDKTDKSVSYVIAMSIKEPFQSQITACHRYQNIKRLKDKSDVGNYICYQSFP
jgi:hypothetical protein